MSIKSAKVRTRFMAATTIIAAGCLTSGCAGDPMPYQLAETPAQESATARPVAAFAAP